LSIWQGFFDTKTLLFFFHKAFFQIALLLTMVIGNKRKDMGNKLSGIHLFLNYRNEVDYFLKSKNIF